jgi:hypothetical protein
LGYYLGHLLYIQNNKKNGKTFDDTLNEWSLEYGPVYKYQFITDQIIFTTEPTAVKVK